VSLAARLKESRFLRFAVVGGLGFFINEAVLFAAILFLHLGAYAGQIFAFLITVTFTWSGNRFLTFRAQAAPGARGMAAEWFKFLLANTLGFAANYAIYVALVAFAPAPLNSPYVALAFGTLAGLAFNFTLSKRFVFSSASSDR
jgi:putative flippase GtrA